MLPNRTHAHTRTHTYAPHTRVRTTHARTHTHAHTQLNPDRSLQPSALSPLSDVAHSDEPPVAAFPPLLHHTLYLERRGPIKHHDLCVHL